MESNSTMAATIRSNAKWPIIVSSILMAVTIGSFGLSSLINDKSGSMDLNLKNWKTTITSKELREIYNQEAGLLFQFQYQYQMNPEQASGLLNRIVVQTAIQLKDAERKNIRASEKEIIEKINNEKMFEGENGKFSAKKYDEYLGYMYKSQKDTLARRVLYEKKIANDIIKDKLKEEVTKSVKPTEQEIKDEFHNKFDTVEYEYVTFTVDSKKAPEPTAEEIKKNYESNANSPEFMTEEMIKAKYIFFPYSKYEAEAPNEEEAQAYYDKNKADYIEKEVAPIEPSDQPPATKYKPFKNVRDSIIQKLKDEKTKAKAEDVTDKIHTEMSNIKTEKGEVDIVKAYETIKPANGIFGETTYFSETTGANELIGKFGEIKDFRTQAFSNLDKLTLQRINLPKGVLFYFAYKSDIIAPKLKPLEECKAKIIETLKEEKAWTITEKKANDFLKTCESDTWVKSIEAQSLKPANHKVAINEAVGKHKSFVTSLLEKKINTGKFFVQASNRDLPDKEFYVVLFKDRVKASDEKFLKQKEEIRTSLEGNLKTKAWSDYVSNLPDVAGLPKADEGKK